jgi:hypothetical protein
MENYVINKMGCIDTAHDSLGKFNKYRFSYSQRRSEK